MSFEKPSQELSVGTILSRSFDLYLAKFALFFVPFLLAGLVTGAWSAAVSLWFPLPSAPDPHAAPEVIFEWLFAFIAALIVMLALTLVVSWIIGTIVQGMVVKCASDVLERGDASLQESFSFTMSRLFSLLAVGIITGILVVVGLICLIVPGIILAIMFSLVVPAIMIERIGALESLSRSRRLVSRRWGKTFVLLLVVYILIGIVSWMASLATVPFGYVGSIVSSVVVAFIQPILPIAMTLFYYSMVVKEEVLKEIS